MKDNYFNLMLKWEENVFLFLKALYIHIKI